MSIEHTQVAVVGGGPAGLSLGFQLQRKNIDFQVFEAQERAGGNIRSEPHEGYLCEWGEPALTLLGGIHKNIKPATKAGFAIGFPKNTLMGIDGAGR